MRGVRNYLAVIVAFLLMSQAGCATSGYRLFEPKSKVIKTYNEAKRLYDQKRYDDAREYFQQFITNHPESPLVEASMYFLGDCYKQKEEFQKAMATYQNLINKYRSGFWADLAKEEIKQIKSIKKK